MTDKKKKDPENQTPEKEEDNKPEAPKTEKPEEVKTKEETPKEETPKAKAPKDKKANIRRVFRIKLWKKGKPFNHSIVTLLQMKQIVAGTEIPEQCIALQPNPANQYVLVEGAIEYEKQLEVLRKWEEGKVIKGVQVIEEVDPKLEGVPWVDPLEVEIKE